jgi:hypothetical protein
VKIGLGEDFKKASSLDIRTGMAFTTGPKLSH